VISTEQKRGLLFTLVGPGGAGKNALMRQVLARLDDLSQLATATTRPIRDDEKQGREHLFLSAIEFQHMINQNELLEWQEVTPGRFYGIPRDTVEQNLFDGTDLIADIDVLGAKILRETYPTHVVLVFITVPGDTGDEKLRVLLERMTGRKDSQDDAVIEKRIQRARDLEFPFAAECDYIIVNDDMDTASQKLYDVILKERSKHRTLESS
jgi:guanylate kinase